MIFWIALGIVFVVYVLWVIFVVTDEDRDGGLVPDLILGTVMASMAMVVVTALLTLVAMWVSTPVQTGVDSKKLASLGTDTGLSGRTYFLGGGYVNSNRTVNYVAYNDNGSVTPADIWADQTSIFEDVTADKARLDVYHFKADVPWWIGPTFDKPTYTDIYWFHVPKGSIKAEYSVES